MKKFHRNKFTGPLDLLQKKNKQKKKKDFRLHGCPVVSWWTFIILLKRVFIWPLTLKDSVHKPLQTSF